MSALNLHIYGGVTALVLYAHRGEGYMPIPYIRLILVYPSQIRSIDCDKVSTALADRASPASIPDLGTLKHSIYQ